MAPNIKVTETEICPNAVSSSNRPAFQMQNHKVIRLIRLYLESVEFVKRSKNSFSHSICILNFFIII